MNVLDRFRLDGRVALVTGGSRGLGRVMAEALASAGASVVSRRATRSWPAKVAGEVAAATGGKTLGHRRRRDQTGRRRRRWSRGRSTPSAGSTSWSTTPGSTSAGRSSSSARTTGTRSIDTNLKGPWLCCRAAGEPMRRQKWGRVVNVSSMLGEISLPGRSPYAASKGGLTLLTKTLALEWAADGVNVNALCPGPFATEINTAALERPGRAGDDAIEGAPRPLGRPGRTRPGPSSSSPPRRRAT